MHDNSSTVHMQKHAIPTTLADPLPTPIIAIWIIDGISPSMPHPLPFMPRYSAGNIASTADALPIKNR